MALQLIESPGSQIPFALCGSSERDQTNPVVVNTFAQSSTCNFGVGVFLLAYVESAEWACAKTAAWVSTGIDETFDPLQGVRAVVSAIKESRPLVTKPSLNELFRQAASSQGTPADIPTWARKLADESDLDD